MGSMRVRVRCPIHGFINLSENECKLLETQEFQRLREIRQLALANLVYPGALHTRFEHSLGVCHLAGATAHRVNLGRDWERSLRFAGLLHDLGHAPFSHVGEEALGLYSDPKIVWEATGGEEKGDIHEVVTADLIRSRDHIRVQLGTENTDRIVELMLDWHGDPIYKSILSSSMDVDKQDYLLRDSYFCGVKYGSFDLDQLQNAFCQLNGAENGNVLAIKKEGVHALEQFILAKFYMTRQVYFHKVRQITDRMLLRSIELGIEEDEIPELKTLFNYTKSDEYLDNYLTWGDHKFFVSLSEKYSNSKCNSVIELLRRRKLLKRVLHVEVRETSRKEESGGIDEAQLSPEAKFGIVNINGPLNGALRKKLEKAAFLILKSVCEGKFLDGFKSSDYVIVHYHTRKDALNQINKEEGSILIAGERQPSSFREKSPLFRSMEREFAEAYFDIYAPIRYRRDQKKQIVRKLRKPLIEAINEVMQGKGRSNGEEATCH